MKTKYDIGDIVMLPFKVTDIKISGKSDIKYNLSSNRMMQPILKNPTFHLEAVNICENDIYALPKEYKNKPDEKWEIQVGDVFGYNDVNMFVITSKTINDKYFRMWTDGSCGKVTKKDLENELERGYKILRNIAKDIETTIKVLKGENND